MHKGYIQSTINHRFDKKINGNFAKFAQILIIIQF